MKYEYTIKKLCIFCLATGVGQMIIDQTDDDKVAWRALKLSESGQKCIDNCQVKIDSSAVKRVKAKIDQICKHKDEYDIVEMLSFLVYGVQELIMHYSKSEMLENLEKRALWFIKIYDPKFEANVHEIAYKRYEEWIKK